MPNRRQILTAAVTAGVLAPLAAWLSGPPSDALADRTFPVQKSDAEWRTQLSPEAYRVLRGHATERAFTSPLNEEKRAGTFVCAGCGHPLFSASTKFESGTGWPSFFEPLRDAVGTSVDSSYFMVRTEVHCARCGGHLGHVFPDGPPPTGLRYCMNGVALSFVASV